MLRKEETTSHSGFPFVDHFLYRYILLWVYVSGSLFVKVWDKEVSLVLDCFD